MRSLIAFVAGFALAAPIWLRAQPDLDNPNRLPDGTRTYQGQPVAVMEIDHATPRPVFVKIKGEDFGLFWCWNPWKREGEPRGKKAENGTRGNFLVVPVVDADGPVIRAGEEPLPYTPAGWVGYSGGRVIEKGGIDLNQTISVENLRAGEYCYPYVCPRSRVPSREQ